MSRATEKRQGRPAAGRAAFRPPWVLRLKQREGSSRLSEDRVYGPRAEGAQAAWAAEGSSFPNCSLARDHGRKPADDWV